MTKIPRPFSLRMPPDLREKAERLAEHNRRTLNMEVLALLERAIGEAYPSARPLLEVTNPDEVRQLERIEVEPAVTGQQAKSVFLRLIENEGDQTRQRAFQIIAMSAVESKLLEAFRRLSPGKQMALLALFEE